MKTSKIVVFLAAMVLLGISCEKHADAGSSAKSDVDSLLALGEENYANPELGEKYLDSAYALISPNKNDSLTRYFYRRGTIAYYNMSLYDKSLASSRKVYELGKSAKDSLSMAKGLHFAAASFYENSENDSAFYYYRQAEEAYKRLSDEAGLGEVIMYKAYIYYNIGEYVLCEEEAFRALKLLMNTNRPTNIYDCYNLIATSLDGQDKTEGAIRYYQLALEQLDDYRKEGYTDAYIAMTRASCYNNMGGVYVKMGNHKKAMEIYQQALSFPEVKDAPNLYAKLLNNLAQAKFKSGDNRGLPEMFYQSLHIRDSLDNQQGIIASNLSLGEYFIANSDTSRAISYLNKAYTEAEEIKSHSDILSSLKLLSAVDKKRSLTHYDRYITLNDSLQDIAESTRNKFARIEYETDRLEDEKAALAKKNTYIIGASVVVLLFVAAIFMIYYLNSRNKELLLIQEQQKANEEIYELMFEQQTKVESARAEEKSRIAMELHDGILNNIYAVRLNLEFINKKADDESILKRKEFIKELQNVESEIRGVSHELSRNAIFNHEQGFENMLEFMITAQKNNFETEFEAIVDRSIDWDSMSNVTKVNIYRIIQETLQNINKYSEAKHAKVEVVRKEDNISVTITDDGIGFEPEKAKGGIGLKNLRKRAEALAGALSIVSEPGKGASIEVVFPA